MFPRVCFIGDIPWSVPLLHWFLPAPHLRPKWVVYDPNGGGTARPTNITAQFPSFGDFGVIRARARTLLTEHRTGRFAPHHLHFHTSTHYTCFVCNHAHVRIRLSRGSPWHVRPVGSLFHRDLPVYGGGASPEPLYRLCACGRCGMLVNS